MKAGAETFPGMLSSGMVQFGTLTHQVGQISEIGRASSI